MNPATQVFLQYVLPTIVGGVVGLIGSILGVRKMRSEAAHARALAAMAQVEAEELPKTNRFEQLCTLVEIQGGAIKEQAVEMDNLKKELRRNEVKLANLQARVARLSMALVELWRGTCDLIDQVSDLGKEPIFTPGPELMNLIERVDEDEEEG